MFPSSNSSSSPSHRSAAQSEATNSTTGAGGLMRNGSAPSSILTTAVDGVMMNPTREFSTPGSNHKSSYSRFFPSEASSLTSDKISSSSYSPREQQQQHHEGINVNTTIGLQRNYGFNHEGNFGIVSSASPSSPLIRHSSSPAGLLNQLAHASAADDNGFPMSRTCNISRLNSQLSFTRPQGLSQISEEHENVVNDLNRECDPRKLSSHSHVSSSSYGIGSWDDDPAGSIMISMGPSKPSSSNNHITGDIVNTLNAMESQLQFSMQPAVMDMSSMEKLLNIPQDSVPCKIRAKRGFATHPRSIAERERRTRISGKLKKLQDLVPNMDKQTSYADMLDLAVQHIQGLQNQVQNLNKELKNCTCGCKKTPNC